MERSLSAQAGLGPAAAREPSKAARRQAGVCTCNAFSGFFVTLCCRVLRLAAIDPIDAFRLPWTCILGWTIMQLSGAIA
jgi:hypothetical protein